jgi:hypothetical protein
MRPPKPSRSGKTAAVADFFHGSRWGQAPDLCQGQPGALCIHWGHRKRREAQDRSGEQAQDRHRSHGSCNVNKVALTKQGLQDRLLESTSKTYSNRANIRQTRNDKQIRSWKMAEYNKEGFYGTVSTQARRLKRAGMSEDAAWAKAFKERPRYSTKQKVRVNWGARNTQMLMS